MKYQSNQDNKFGNNWVN